MAAGGIQARSSGASTGDVLIDGAAAVPARGLVTRSRAASATDRPALRPVCEELTALAPGRVLPFAPGDSRKRGAEAEPRGKSLGECRGGAPRGERARSALRRQRRNGVARVAPEACSGGNACA